MPGVPGFRALAVLEIVLQAWLYKETDVWYGVILKAETHACRPGDARLQAFGSGVEDIAVLSPSPMSRVMLLCGIW